MSLTFGDSLDTDMVPSFILGLRLILRIAKSFVSSAHNSGVIFTVTDLSLYPMSIVFLVFSNGATW